MDLVLTLSKESKTPQYKQLSDALREAILSGRLCPGQVLPSSRDFCQQLGISRFTVRKGYEDLSSQGYIEGTRGGGTYVSKNLPGDLSQTNGTLGQAGDSELNTLDEPVLSEYGKRVLSESTNSKSEPFPQLNSGIPANGELPLSVWRQLLLRYCRLNSQLMLSYSQDPFGHIPLRQSIADYLKRARGILCSPEQIAIFSGSQHALDILCRILLQPGDAVALENPGYPGARRTFITFGSTITPVNVDENGLSIEHLKRMEKPLKLLHVTPSHHDPSAAVLSLPRRLELLAWAKRTGTFIVEDDNDSEYRYGSAPIPALKALDSNDSVVYMSTFWKTLGPVLAMGYIILPRRLVAPYAAAKAMIQRDFPILEQCAMADFIKEGHLERHIKRTRTVYAKRRQSLVHALTTTLRDAIKISRETAGMQMLVQFKQGIDQEAILASAEEADLPLASTASYYIDNPKQGEFLIPFAHFDATELSAKAQRFSQLLLAEAGA